MKTYSLTAKQTKECPPTALEVKTCPPHKIDIELKNIAPEGEKPIYHQIGRCGKCKKFIKDYGPVGDYERKSRGLEACAKGGRNGERKR